MGELSSLGVGELSCVCMCVWGGGGGGGRETELFGVCVLCVVGGDQQGPVYMMGISPSPSLRLH